MRHSCSLPSKLILGFNSTPSQVDAKLGEELLRQEVAEAARGASDAARAEAAGTRAQLGAALRDAKGDLEARLAAAEAAAAEGAAAASERAAVVSAALAAHAAGAEGAAARLGEGLARLRADADRQGDQQRVRAWVPVGALGPGMLCAESQATAPTHTPRPP
jgi:hypothetical protein